MRAWHCSPFVAGNELWLRISPAIWHMGLSGAIQDARTTSTQLRSMDIENVCAIILPLDPLHC